LGQQGFFRKRAKAAEESAVFVISNGKIKVQSQKSLIGWIFYSDLAILSISANFCKRGRDTNIHSANPLHQISSSKRNQGLAL
jgi:hypothetical protein